MIFVILIYYNSLVSKLAAEGQSVKRRKHNAGRLRIHSYCVLLA
jgi:hypothetical protein